MGRNLVVFFDGTGNDRSHGAATNVARLSDIVRNMRVVPGAAESPKPWQDLAGEALDAEVGRADVTQLTHYVVGVGSGFGDWIGKATGFGISRKIRDGYDFLVRFYEPGDRIWLFGFSRGAYAARSLGGLVGLVGLPPRRLRGRDLRHDADARSAHVHAAYEVYRVGSGEGEPGRVRREAAAGRFRHASALPEHAERPARAPYFIGVWDTVRSLGWALRQFDLEVFFSRHLFHDHELNPFVAHAYHALSIDDRRLAFHPTLWNEPTLAAMDTGSVPGPRQGFEQVWFPGVHADIGGGYVETGLSDITLGWMIDRALRPDHPLAFTVRDPLGGLAPDPLGKLHDPLEGLFDRLLYRILPRSVLKGVQDALSKAIARRADEAADLHPSWKTRLTAPGSTYDTPHLRGHPVYDGLRPPDPAG